MKQNTIIPKSGVLALALCIIMCISTSSWATSYYVDSTSGSDVNTGTQSSPWKTIAKVNSSKYQAGDKILFQSGQTWREQLNVPFSGAADNPITFGAYGSGSRPILNGANLVSGTWTQYSGNIFYKSTSLLVDKNGNKWVWWNGQKLTQASGYTNLQANQFYYASGTLYLNIGKNPATESIEVMSRQYALYLNGSNIVFDGINFTKAEFGISQYSTTATDDVIRNCVIDYTRIAIYGGQSSSVNCKNWIVENNVFANIGVHNTYDQGIYNKWGTGWVIQNNSFSNIAAFAMDFNGTSNNIVRYNTYSGTSSGPTGQQGFIQFDGAGGGSTNNQIYYNLVVGGQRLIYVGSGSGHTGNKIYNNTVYNYTYAAINVTSSNKDLTVINNILWSTASGSKAYRIESGCALQGANYNDLGPEAAGFIMYNGTNYNTLASFKSAYSAFDQNSKTMDPLFMSLGSNFNLSSNSPAIGAGLNVGLTKDYAGNPVPAAPAKPSIGAYQTGQSAVLPAPTKLTVT